MEIESKVMVVTGGGNGIGRELVLALLKKGARVAAVDISAKALQETAGLAGSQSERLSTHVVNITDRSAVEALPAAVLAAHTGVVDGLINCAGIIQPFVKFKDLAYADIERMINVNFYGMVYMTKTFLPFLLSRPEAHIVNISSMGGYLPVPGQTLYGASKAAVKLFTEGLYSELMDTHVHVTTVFPGAIGTNIAANSGVTISMGDSSAKNTIKMTTPQSAAEQILKGVERNSFQVYVGNDAKMMNFLYRLMPKRATQIIYNQMRSLLR
ncbi:short-chain dehydrogenase of various substrate specificities [Longilinea arvoryzae]|uniref:Short-chain dehydrogenase of various substrate specificities n=1 Tax=Longilinea arvoryzae TaxID=360412 RepID=A0A0S7BBT8_9CHLR|nr:SDR family oxidoreductase [Longilinea arvoryzae]GAP12733.1 short-chain dehydrogenase of various substrate specificities [Longilinea arvoryzae]